MPLSIEERIQVILLAANGRTHREIADEFCRLHQKSISHSTVGNLLAKFKETGSVCDRGRHCLAFGDDSNNGFEQPPVRPANEMESSSSSVYSITNGQKRYRYAVVDIRGQSSDNLYDLLIDNGYSNFLLLNNLSDHPDFDLPANKKDESMPVLNLECESDISRAPSSNDAPDDIPYFAEVSATDLLGAASGSGTGDGDDVDEAKNDQKPAALFENRPRHDFPNTTSKDSFELNDLSEQYVQQSESGGEGTDSEMCDADVNGGGKMDCKSPYVMCQLCKKVIMASRFSNLSNHARRHSVVKKYKCIYCDLQHNEHVKIRAHMTNLHDDSTSEAIDNTWRMKKVWEFLVQKCFPHYTPLSNHIEPQADSDNIITPSTETILYACRICGFQDGDESKVRWHVTSRHTGVICDDHIKVVLTDSSTQASNEQNEAAEEKARVVVLPSQEPSPVDVTTSPKEDTSYEVYVAKEDGDDESGLRSLVCRLCNRIIDGKGLISVVMHAKAHYHVKQFECNRCGFGSNTRSLVRRHIYSQHRRGCTVVLEHNDVNIKRAWTQVVRACFPYLSSLLEKEQNKSERNGLELDLEL
ncbi:unnamed protein product [Haemonchus placei]|uniref:C2H2-type domain-containing protein n=1 Tax=Haemonchus placei TaxID=6290 RepID=A0A0N4WEM2_HAEPC|nr:unnamed protein product [Haemonchus placei]